MRKLFGALLSLVFLAGCGETTDTILTDTPQDGGALGSPTAMELFDGSSGQEGANPHFFFLSPIVQNPAYSGIADDSLEPVVTVCNINNWGAEEKACSDPEATFSMDATDSNDQLLLDPGTKYTVVWKTNRYPALAGEIFRISVAVAGRALGWVDVKSYDQQTYSSFQHTDPDGYVAISDNGSMNISFRIEEGALEAAFCDPSGIEDCDVALFDYETGGFLRVYELPGQSNETLGAQIEVPAFAAEIEGTPVEGTYAVILELEEDGNFQSGRVPSDQQVPYFVDIRTDPPGIDFNLNSPGVSIVLCQDIQGTGSIPEALHQFLVAFLVRETPDGGTATTLLPTTFGAPECEGFDPNHHQTAQSAAADGSLLTRLARGVSQVRSFLLPRPLHAFRLHGGLNTVVWEMSESDGTRDDETRRVESNDPGFTLNTVVAELGAVLDVDLLESTATVPATGIVGAETTIIVEALNAQGDPFPFEVPVFIDVTGANTATDSASYLGFGLYEATYTPTAPGTDDIVITIDGDAMPGPYTSDVFPVGPSAAGSTFEVSYSEAGSPTTVTVTVADENGNPYVDGEAYPIQVELNVTGANAATATATDDDGNGTFDGTYVATYTPQSYGDDEITVTINGDPTGDSPFTVTTAPRPFDPDQSTATIQGTATITGGLVDAATTVTVEVRNTAGEVYDYADLRPIAVEFSVTGANTAGPFAASDPEGDGTYTASYTPTNAGTDFIAVTVDGIAIAGSPFTSEVAPLSGDLTLVVDIQGGAPADGLPVILYQNGAEFGTGTTNANGTVTFIDIDFGPYTAHLPKRDFDVTFDAMTMSFEHDQAPNTVTFTGTTATLPEGARVWRIRDGGNGNAFQYMVGTRSWTSAQNQIRDDVLLGVQAHLATLTSAEENAFVANFFVTDPSLCPNETNEKRCKYKGWIGLHDQNTETVFEWVTGEATGFFSWPDGNTAADQPLDRKGNMDHVEIDMLGIWSIINGASSTNEGYFAEWEVQWPTTPPFGT